MSEHYNQIVAYIRDHLAQGSSEQSLREHMIAHGWDAQQTDEAFRIYHERHTQAGSVPPPAQTAAHQPAVHTAHQASQPKLLPGLDAKKYTVFASIGHSATAFRANWLAIVISMLVCITISILGYVVITFGTVALALVLIGTSGFMSPTGLGATSLMLVLGFAIVYLLWNILSYSFTISCLALASVDGAYGRRSSVSTTLKNGLKSTLTVAKAEALYMIILLAPLLVMMIFMIFLAAASGPGSSTGAVVIALGMLFWLVWALITIFRFSLMPFVALFEGDVRTFETPGRSKHLLFKGGQWFLLKLIVLCIALFLIFSLIFGGFNTDTTGTEENIGGEITLNIIFILGQAFVGIIMSMLYMNRRIVRGSGRS